MTTDDWKEIRSIVVHLADHLAVGDAVNPAGVRIGIGEMLSAALGDGDFAGGGAGLGARVSELASAVEQSGSDIASAIRELAEAVRERS